MSCIKKTKFQKTRPSKRVRSHLESTVVGSLRLKVSIQLILNISIEVKKTMSEEEAEQVR
jgi:hypothetical protein